MTELDQALAVCPVVAILRASDASRFGEVSDVLTDAGLRAVEYTFSSAGVVDALAAYAARKPAEVALGAGTVTKVEEAKQAVDAGATYLISPAVCLDVIEEGARLGVPVVPGALTPSEILTAWRAGAAMVKVFPIGPAGGPPYLKAIRGPLADIPLLATGNIPVNEARAYLDAGAAALGMGAPLLGDAGEPGGDLTALGERTRQLLASLPSS